MMSPTVENEESEERFPQAEFYCKLDWSTSLGLSLYHYVLTFRTLGGDDGRTDPDVAEQRRG
jgi:hypothetical protein